MYPEEEGADAEQWLKATGVIFSRMLGKVQRWGRDDMAGRCGWEGAMAAGMKTDSIN